MEKISKRRVINICVFCGSSVGNNPKFVEAAEGLGRIMAERKMHLIYGGGNLGLMGIISNEVRKGGSQVFRNLSQNL